MAIPPARLAHHQPVSRLPSSAQVPPTAPTVPTPAGWAQRPRTRHSPASLATGSKDASPQTTAPTLWSPSGQASPPPGHPHHETRRLPTDRPPEASGLLARHKGLLSPYPPIRAHDSPAHPARNRPSRPPSLTPGHQTPESIQADPTVRGPSSPPTRYFRTSSQALQPDATVPGPPPPHRLALDQSLMLVPGRCHRTRRYVH